MFFVLGLYFIYYIFMVIFLRFFSFLFYIMFSTIYFHMLLFSQHSKVNVIYKKKICFPVF